MMKKHLAGALLFTGIFSLCLALHGLGLVPQSFTSIQSAEFSANSIDSKIPPQELIVLPRLISEVSGIEITSAQLSTTKEELELEIRNYTARSVIGLMISSRGRRGGTGMGHAGTMLMGPLSTLRTTFPVTNLLPGLPLSVSVVVWDDLSVSGDPGYLRFQKRFLESVRKSSQR